MREARGWCAKMRGQRTRDIWPRLAAASHPHFFGRLIAEGPVRGFLWPVKLISCCRRGDGSCYFTRQADDLFMRLLKKEFAIGELVRRRSTQLRLPEYVLSLDNFENLLDRHRSVSRSSVR